MARYIDADALKELEEMEYIYFTSPAAVPFYEADKVWDAIKAAPTADVVEVKHGRWIWNDEDECWICSNCELSALNNYRGDSTESNYCPYCGAKMDGDTDGKT